EMFVVLKAESDAPTAYRGFMRFGTNVYGSNYPWTSKMIQDDFGTSTQNLVGDPMQPLDAYHLYDTSSRSSEWMARINGQTIFRNPANSVSFPTIPWLGKMNFGQFFAGDFAEIIV